MKGAEQFAFKTLSEALVNVGALIEKESKPVYVHLYFDKIDSLAHEYGPTAAQTEAEIETFLPVMEHYFERIFKGKKRILFLMTADHGQVEVDPKTTLYLNTHANFKGFEQFIRTNRGGKPLIPAGSARDMFLYIKEEMLDEAQAFLASRLEGKADVVKTEALISKGFFGRKFHPVFESGSGIWSSCPMRASLCGGTRKTDSR